MYKNIKQIKTAILGILALVVYFTLPLFQTLPFKLMNVDLATVPTILKSLYMGCFEILIIAIIVFIFRDLLTEKWHDFKQNHKEYFNKYFKYWFLLIGLMMLSNIIILLITKNTDGAANQQQIIELFHKAPLYTYISAVFFAPIIEELVFRQGIYNIIPKPKIAFIIISGLLFGSLHVLGNTTDLTQLLYIIPYSIPGLIFAYVLTKTDNIFTTIGLHFFHNGLLMALQVILFICS